MFTFYPESDTFEQFTATGNLEQNQIFYHIRLKSWRGLCILLKRIFQKCFCTNKRHRTSCPQTPSVACPTPSPVPPSRPHSLLASPPSMVVAVGGGRAARGMRSGRHSQGSLSTPWSGRSTRALVLGSSKWKTQAETLRVQTLRGCHSGT